MIHLKTDIPCSRGRLGADAWEKDYTLVHIKSQNSHSTEAVCVNTDWVGEMCAWAKPLVPEGRLLFFLSLIRPASLREALGFWLKCAVSC